MKKNYPSKNNFFSAFIFLVFTTLFFSNSLVAQVGIGTSDPDPSAILHIQSTDKGVLLPKVDLENLTDKNTVHNPTEGLLVYNRRDDNAHDLRKGFYIWDDEKWDKVENQSDIDDIMEEIDERFNELEDGSGWALTGNNFDNVSNAENKFLGTKSYHSLILKTNKTQIAEFDPHGGVALGFGAVAHFKGVAIGTNAKINNDESVSIGTDSQSGSKGIALGYAAKTESDQATALGYGANAKGSKSIALGGNAISSSDENVALGYSAIASGSKAAAIGNSAKASANQTLALGKDAAASGSDAFAIGTSASATQNKAFAIGDGAKATSSESFAIGQNASSASDHGMAIGVGAKTSSQQNAFALGVNSQASGNNSMALGHSSNVSGQYAAAIGFNSEASKQNATALGSNSNAMGQNSTAIGYDAQATKRNTIIIGNSDAKVGIGTSDPTAKLHVNGTFRYVDGSQGTDKVLTSDANGNATWKDLNNGNSGSTGKVYADLYTNSSARLNNTGQASVVKFGVNSLSKNIKIEQDGIQVKEGGIFKISATITVNTEGDDAEDTVYEFYFAKWTNKIAGSSAYITIDSAIDDNEKYTVTLNKLLKLEQWEQVAVYGRQVNVGGNDRDASKLSLVNGACSFTLEKIDEI